MSTSKSINKIFDYVILGGGLYGMQIAKLLKNKFPEKSIMILEKKKKSQFEKNFEFLVPLENSFMYKEINKEISQQKPNNSLKSKFVQKGVGEIKKFCSENGIEIFKQSQFIFATKEVEKKRMNNISGGKLNRVTSEELLVGEPAIVNESKLDNYDIYLNNETYLVDFQKIHKALYNSLDPENSNLQINFDINIDRISSDSVDKTVSLKSDKKEYNAKFLINCSGVEALKFSQQLNSSEMKDHSSANFYFSYHRNQIELSYPKNIISTPPFFIHPGISLYKQNKTLTLGPTIRLNEGKISFIQKLRNLNEWRKVYQIFHKKNIEHSLEFFYNNKTQAGLFFYQLFGLNFFKFSNEDKYTFQGNLIYSSKNQKIEEDFIFIKGENYLQLLNFNMQGGFTSFIPASEEAVRIISS